MRFIEKRGALFRGDGLLDGDGIRHLDVDARGPRLQHDAIPVEERGRPVAAPLDGERRLERRRRPQGHFGRSLDERCGQSGAVAAMPGIGGSVEAGRDRERVRHPCGI